jgi:hypothetical protein
MSNPGRWLAAVAALMAGLATAANVRAQAPAPREVASTALVIPGLANGLAPAGDNAVYLLVEPDTNSPLRVQQSRYVLRADRSGKMSSPIAIRRPDETYSFFSGSPIVVAPSGDMMIFEVEGVSRFDAKGAFKQTRKLRWGKPAVYDGDLRIAARLPDGSAIINGGVQAGPSVQWLLKVGADGAVGWTRRLGAGSTLSSYRVYGDGTGRALWDRRLSGIDDDDVYQTLLTTLDRNGRDIGNVAIDCKLCRGVVTASNVIVVREENDSMRIEVFDFAGRRLATAPWPYPMIAHMVATDDGMVASTDTGDPDDPAEGLLIGVGAKGTVLWHRRASTVYDIVRAADGEIVTLSMESAPREGLHVFHIDRYALP